MQCLFTKTSRLTIITACARPHNLHHVAKSINWTDCDLWLIVHDTRSRPFVRVFPEDSKIIEVACAAPQSIAGNGPKNLGLSLVSSGYIYFVDDDNLVHPAFWTSVWPLIKAQDQKSCILTFDMEYINGRVLSGSDPRPTQIDTAMFVFDRECCGPIRWIPMEYTADGHFIEAVIKRCPKAWSYVPITAAWYNRLQD